MGSSSMVLSSSVSFFNSLYSWSNDFLGWQGVVVILYGVIYDNMFISYLGILLSYVLPKYYSETKERSYLFFLDLLFFAPTKWLDLVSHVGCC